MQSSPNAAQIEEKNAEINNTQGKGYEDVKKENQNNPNQFGRKEDCKTERKQQEDDDKKEVQGIITDNSKKSKNSRKSESKKQKRNYKKKNEELNDEVGSKGKKRGQKNSNKKEKTKINKSKIILNNNPGNNEETNEMGGGCPETKEEILEINESEDGSNGNIIEESNDRKKHEVKLEEYSINLNKSLKEKYDKKKTQ